MLTITPTTESHLKELSLTMREKDKAELKAYMVTPQRALWRSYKRSAYSKTALIDGKVAAIWGVAGVLLGDEGTPWLLTSDEVYKVTPLVFARIYSDEVNEMLNLYPTLVNVVDIRYTEAVRMLKIMGFKIYEPVKIKNGMFSKFELRR